MSTAKVAWTDLRGQREGPSLLFKDKVVVIRGAKSGRALGITGAVNRPAKLSEQKISLQIHLIGKEYHNVSYR